MANSHDKNGPAAVGVTGEEPALTSLDGRQSAAALAIQRGAQRALLAHGFASLTEVTLRSGRRVDILAINDRSEIWIVEVKSCLADFRSDAKWPDYRDYCDRLWFAVAPDFPVEVLPADAGLILADRYAGELVRWPKGGRLAAHLRKAVVLTAARTAAVRLQGVCDPETVAGIGASRQE
jgi:hypothetical protein